MERPDPSPQELALIETNRIYWEVRLNKTDPSVLLRAISNLLDETLTSIERSKQ
jgi:hypothetical protein